MAERFLQVDLSKDARDFQHVALADAPILDAASANDRKLRKALGRLAAQAERKGDRVSFFVVDDSGARPHGVFCEPVTEADIKKDADLARDVAELERRINQVEIPELRDRLLRLFQEARKGTARPSPFLFKYRGADRKLRLVWCWGYQRRDLEPGNATICSNSSCRALFIKRGNDPLCPVCKKAPEVADKPVKAGRASRWPWLVAGAATAACLVFAALYFLRNDDKPVPPAVAELVITPVEWKGPAGARIDYTITRKNPDGTEEDLTHSAIARSDDPKVLRVERGSLLAKTRAPGKCVVKFHIGQETAQATVEVVPPTNPDKIYLEPADVTLAVGSTARLKVMGDYQGNKVDLTDAAQWEPVENGPVFAHRGLVEGLSPGQAAVNVSFNATDDKQKAQRAAATVVVNDEEFSQLEFALDRSELAKGQTTNITATAKTKSGKSYSVADSSQLEVTSQPGQLVERQHHLLRAMQVGEGKVVAHFQGLTAEASLKVSPEAVAEEFAVYPNDLSLVVGEQAEIEVVSGSEAPVRLTSSKPDVAEIVDRKVVARAAGKATITVEQDGQKQEVEADVRRETFQSLAIKPAEITVAIDESLPLSVVATLSDGAEVTLAPDELVMGQLPAPAFVDVDLDTFTVRGLRPTEDPQLLAVRVGELETEAEIRVVAAPLRLEIEPAGPLTVPSNQSAQLAVFAAYADGRRVGLEAGQVRWQLSPSQPQTWTFDERTGTAIARQEGSETLKVSATYQGSSANTVELRSAPPAPSTLVLATDHEPLLVGETGQFRAAWAEPAQNVDLAGLTFASDAPDKLAIDPRTGAFTAVAAGEAQISAQHAAASGPATHKVRILDPSEAKLELRPAKVPLTVDGRQELTLALVSAAGERLIPLVGNDDVRISHPQPAAAEWDAPWLVGRAPAAPFTLAVEWQGQWARATVEVVKADAQQPPKLRVQPAEVPLAPGQPHSPVVEQQVGESWVEVTPQEVTWKVDRQQVDWTPPAGDLRPQLALLPAAKDSVTIEAQYRGSQATLTVRKKSAGELPKSQDPEAELVVAREPDGETIEAPGEQRYQIVIQKGSQREPAPHVEWQPAFQNEHVRWQPPVLIAKKGEHLQPLWASVDGRQVHFQTRVVAPAAPPAADPPPASGKPRGVRIVSRRGEAISIPLQTEFSDFRVEAASADGPIVDVTAQATLTAEGDAASSPVSLSGQRIRGIRAGKAVVKATYAGVVSRNALQIEVTEDAPLTAISIEPKNPTVSVGESLPIRVIGYTGTGESRQSLGDISARGDVVFKTDQPEILRAGPSITGLQRGKATLSVQAGMLNNAVDVSVIGEEEEATAAEQLVVEPGALRLAVNESRAIGSDVRLMRSGIDLTDQASVVSSNPAVVRIDADRNSVVGVSPGTADLALAYRGQNVTLPVTVEPAQAPQGKVQVVLEPASGTLAVGEPLEVRVIVVDQRGGRQDRTASASIQSDQPEVLSVRGSQLVGQKAGQATITARVADSDTPATGSYTVAAEEFTAFDVTPAELELNTGESRALRVEGIGPNGRRDVTGHPELTVTAGGEQPDAVQVDGLTVRGASGGKATLSVKLGSLAAQTVPVAVTDAPWSDLRIEPADKTIGEGEEQAYLVFAKRGANERSVTAADGVQIKVDNTSVAQAGEGLLVRGVSPGFATVTVRLGDLRADAKLTVEARITPQPPAVPPKQPPGLRFIPDILTLQLGTPGASVRVVKVSADGREEDVDHRTVIDFLEGEATDVVSKEWTASGPVFKPLKLGVTKVRAAHEGAQTSRPLVIEVVDEPLSAKLEVLPDPVTLAVGQTKQFQQVRIAPGRGRAAIDAHYEVTSTDPAIVAIEGGRTLRGVAAGETTVEVKPVGVDERFAKLVTRISVRVTEEAADKREQGHLVLTGPDHTTVGAEAQFAIEIDGQDVTRDGAMLVLNRDEAELAETRPGGVLVGKRAAVVSLKAQYKDKISNSLTVRIEDVAKAFARLELELDAKPLMLGESRSYKLWGYPADGGPRQDVTGGAQAGGAAPQVSVTPASGVVEHAPPQLIAKAAGTVEVSASIGEGEQVVQSPSVHLQVVDETAADATLSADPPSVSVRLGERTPPIRILARRPGEAKPRQIDATFTSQDPAVLEPSAEGFVGKQAGQTKLIAKVGEQEIAVDVTVTGNPFSDVTLEDKPEGAHLFSVIVRIVGQMPEGAEYRVVNKDGAAGDAPWQSAQAQGDNVNLEINSPKLPLTTVGATYHLVLEARTQGSSAVERYPLSFSIGTKSDGR